jgi:hypothetical protein
MANIYDIIYDNKWFQRPNTQIAAVHDISASLLGDGKNWYLFQVVCQVPIDIQVSQECSAMYPDR